MDVKKVRRDFPIYSSHESDMIYLDNACQTFRPRTVIDAMDEYYLDYPACGGRSVHKLATKVSVKVEEARERIASFIGTGDPERIVFTKNCTEAINLVAKGFPFNRSEVVVTTDMEHNSNHVPWLQVSAKIGLVHKFVRTPDSGLFDLEEFTRIVSSGARMVSLVHTNNVTGTTLPTKDIINIAHENGALVMLDGAQSVPHRSIDVERMDVDVLTFSMHKMLGPSGVGVLYAKPDILEKIEPLIGGGGGVGTTTYDEVHFLRPPEKFESGLLNYSGIIGSGAAIDYLSGLGMDDIADHEIRLNRVLTNGLKDVPSILHT